MRKKRRPDPAVSEAARQLAARRRPKTVTCPICGVKVVGLGRRKYCSPKHAKLAWWRQNRQHGGTTTKVVTVKYVGTKRRTCALCGKVLWAKYGVQHCSPARKQEDQRQYVARVAARKAELAAEREARRVARSVRQHDVPP